MWPRPSCCIVYLKLLARAILSSRKNGGVLLPLRLPAFHVLLTYHNFERTRPTSKYGAALHRYTTLLWDTD